MAKSDLQGYLNTILEAKKGETVRDAIINASKSLQKMTKNAGSLEGHLPEYFASKQRFWDLYYDIIVDFDDINDLEDSEYAFQSKNIVSSATLYGIIMKHLKPSLHNISHYENDPNDEKEAIQAVKDYLETIEKVKEEIGKSIKAKGKSVKNAKSFEEYAEILKTIDDSVPELISDEFTENKEYEASTEQGTTVPYAYESFTVNIDKSKEMVKGSGNENGKTYYPPEGKLFSSFDVNVRTRSSVSSRVGSSYRKRGTSSSGDEELLDENGLIKIFPISENGTYTAEEEGVNGFATLSVHITEPKVEGKKFTVTFMKGGDILGEPVVVPAYGNAYYEGEPPVSDDPSLVFSGWVPNPIRVTSDMQCQAFFKAPGEITPGEIQDSWEEIIDNAGSKYKIGDYKSLNLGTINNRNYGTLIFEKVYSGESSSTSTWLSKTLLPTSLVGGIEKWPISGSRTFLNGEFIEDLRRTEDGARIADAVIPVKKYTITNWPGTLFDGHDNYVNVDTVDRFWIPSAAELYGFDGNLAQCINSCYSYYNNSQNYYYNEPFKPNVRVIETGDQIVCYGTQRTSARCHTTITSNTMNVAFDSGDFSFFQKTSSTDPGGTIYGYLLRTIGSFGSPTHGEYRSPNPMGVDRNGQLDLISSFGSEGNCPIGFCI